MIIACDFDGTVVQQNRAYEDVESPLEFVAGADMAIPSLKRADHVLLLWSARSSRALLYDPLLNPLVRSGAVPFDMDQWKASQHIHLARYRQMLDFIGQRCIGWFDAIDDGAGGKPLVDMFIDDRALRLGTGLGALGWWALEEMYGAAGQAR